MKPIIYNLSNIRMPLTGIGRYAIELIREMLCRRPNIAVIKNGRVYRGQDIDQLLKQHELSSSSLSIHSTQQFRNLIGKIPLSRSVYRSIDKRRFTRLSNPLIQNGGAYHDLNYSLNPNSGHNIATVYDLSNLVCPETHPAHRVKYLNAYFQKLRVGSAQIITISDAVKSELIQHYGIAEDRIHVTHLAADHNFRARSKDDCRIILNAQALTYKKYTLCVATLEPRKNLSRVLTAFESLDQQTQREYPLAMVGPLGWKSAELEQRISRLSKTGVIRPLGFVAQHELPYLYAGATAFIFASQYEGFGLPLLEAMQSGCPCITSNTGALAEVSAQHAIQVDPNSNDDIADQLNRLLQDADLRSYYSDSGQQRANDFSWAKTARKTDKIYNTLGL